MACTFAQAASRPSLLRSHLGADRGFVGFREAGESQTDVSSVLIECALERLIDLMQLRESELHDPRERKMFLMFVPFGLSQSQQPLGI